VERNEGAWRVVIVDPEGRDVFERPFGKEDEARMFASTVGQHASWLSEAKFRRYYRLPEEAEDGT
jgi:hypothetical protein